MVSETALAASAKFMAVANRLPTLWELSDEFNGLVDLLESEDADEEAIAAELQRVAGDIRRKSYGIAALITTVERMAEMQDAEAKRLAAKAKANRSHGDRMRKYVLDAMKAIEQDRIETGTFTLAIRQNNPSVVVDDALAVPSEFERRKTIIETDKLAILAYYKKSGEIPPGVSIVRNQRLEIK